MNLPAFIFTLLFFIVNSLFAQVNHDKAQQIVLKRNQVGKVYSFNESKDVPFNKTSLHNYDSLVLVYLGRIETTDGRVLKVLTSRWYWGTSPRATNRIIVFNSRNKYLGDYYLTMTYDVPDKIEGSSLVFVNDEDSDCTPGLVTKVNFRRGIPKQFFLKCQGKFGDIYSFSQNL